MSVMMVCFGVSGVESLFARSGSFLDSLGTNSLGLASGTAIIHWEINPTFEGVALNAYLYRYTLQKCVCDNTQAKKVPHPSRQTLISSTCARFSPSSPDSPRFPSPSPNDPSSRPSIISSLSPPKNPSLPSFANHSLPNGVP